MNVNNKNALSIKLQYLLFNTLFFLVILKLLTSYSTHLEIHSNLSKGIDLIILMVALYTIAKLKKNLLATKVRLLFIASFFMIYILIVNSYYGVGISAFVYYSRLYIPILVYIAFTCCIHKLVDFTIHKKMFFFISLAVLLTILGFYFMPINFNHGEYKLPTYFSGLHKSSYIFAFLIIAAFISLKYMTGILKVCLILSVFFMIYMMIEGWAIRTPFLAVIFFFYCYSIEKLDVNMQKAVFLGILLSFILFIFIYGGDIDWNKISSGRLVMWETKVYMFFDATFFEAFLGRGYGSDYIEVGDWWGELDSHNNYLQTLTELGVIGLLFLLATICFLYKSQNSKISGVLVLAYALTGLFSNGVIYRVLPSYIFILTLIYFQLIINNKQNLIEVENAK
jgi:hypothetical protein